MNGRLESLITQIIDISQRLAAVVATNRMSRQQASAELYGVIQAASGGDAALAEQLVSALCSHAENLFDQDSPLTLAYVIVAHRVADAFGDPFYRGRAAHTLGKTLKKQGRFREAQQAFLASLEDFGTEYPVHAEIVVGDLGNIAFSLGDYDEAERLLRHALAAALRQNNIHNQLGWKLALGNTLVFTGKNEEALELLEGGLRQARSSGRPYHEGAFLTGIANVYENLGKFDECVQHHQSAISISRRIGDKESELHDLFNLGNLQFRFNRHDEALELYRQSYGLAVELKHRPLQAQLMEAIANVFLKRGSVEKAISLFERAIQMCREEGAVYTLLRGLGNLGSAYYLTGELEKARACHQESLDLSRRNGDQKSAAQDLRSLALVTQKLGDIEKALEYAEEASGLADQLQDPSLMWSTERMLANLLRKTPTRHGEVWGHYERAMDTIETLRRHVRADHDRIDLYSGHQYSLYEEAVSWLLDNGDVERAFETAERFKSRLLLDVMAERATGKLSQPESARQLLTRAQAGGPETSTASYFMTREETILFFAAPGHLTVEHVRIPLGLDAHLEWFERWFNLLPDSADYDSPSSSLEKARKTLEELDDILVRPLRGLLQQHPRTTRVLIIPHRFLHSAPIHAARDPETGRYLAEDVIVTYLPALQLLNPVIPEPSQQTPSVLAVGEPSTNLMPLPAALAEARAVADLFGTRLLSGSDATVQSFAERARHARIIHLACHCKFDVLHPERSHLLMAGNEPLTAEAITGMQLGNVDLISMAACESGRARPGGVDESLGLTRAWLISGADFVLGAQWQVDDETSKTFMLDFYSRVREGVKYVNAFGAAQRAIINRAEPYNDPRMWPPFILMGCS